MDVAQVIKRRWVVGVFITILIIANVFVLSSGRKDLGSNSPSTRGGIPDSASLVPGIPRLRAVFIGDSFMYPATKDTPSWSRILADRLGWDEVNLGRGGTGYATSSKTGCGKNYCPTFNEMLPEVLNAKPDIVIVAGGGNDRGNVRLSASVSGLFKSLRASLPTTRIIAISPFWNASTYPVWLKKLGVEIKAACGSNNAQYLDIGHPFEDEPKFVQPDGIHPSVEGHRQLAQSVLTALEER